jgi:predicted RNA binding protein YcfA (HicA-like mRNA interferase family)
MKHPDGRATVIPVHAKETIGPGLFSKILRDADLSRQEFLDLIEE